MTKKYDVFALGNARVDTEIEVSDAFLERMDVGKGLMTLVEQFRLAAEQGKSIGDLDVLRRYQSLHRQDWQQTVRFSDSLVRVFGQSMPPITAARDAGLVGLDLLPGAKRWFARKAMGLGGRRAVIDRPGNVNREVTRHE